MVSIGIYYLKAKSQQAVETAWTKVNSCGLGLLGSVNRDTEDGGQSKHIKKIEGWGRTELGRA